MRSSGLLLLCLLAGLTEPPAPPLAPRPAPSRARSAQSRKKPRARAAKQRGPRVRPMAAKSSPPPPPAEAHPPAEPASRAPAWGSVTYATSGRAYLDAGRDEGLSPGQELSLTRREGPSATCRVEHVADHRATCAGQGMRVGDRFALPRTPQVPAAESRPALATAAELARRRTVVVAVEQPLVEFQGGAQTGLSRRLPATAALGHDAWVSTQSGDFQRERVDVALRGMPLGAGFRLHVDATAWHWTRRPEDFRFPARGSTQLYVREGEITLREPDRRLTLAVGRVWPWYVPGVALFDGVQVGWRRADDSLEVGAFGGGVPDPVTLSPSFRRFAAGAYVTGQHTGGEDATLRLLRHEARVSYASFPEVGQRVEAEGRVRAWLGRSTDVGAWVRLGLGDARAPAGVDAARLDVDVRPADSWRLTAGVRYAGTSTVLDVPTLGDPTFGNRSLHADASAAWEVAPWLTAGLSGLVMSDFETSLDRQLAGPELALPRLFGARGGLSLGYQEELGWLRGRSAYVQAVLRPFSSLRLLGRASYFEDAPPEGTPMSPLREVGLYTSAEYAPVRWLSLRISLLGRLDATPLSEDADRPGGLMGHATLAGTF